MLFVPVQAARAKGIDCIVAPYEADAQLAYLNKAGIVQAVITEDSDLLAFGCKKVGEMVHLFYAKGNAQAPIRIKAQLPHAAYHHVADL